MTDGNVADFIGERVRRGLGPIETAKTTGGKGGGDGEGGTPGMSDISGRLSKLEGGFDVLKVLISVMAAVMLGGFAFLGTQTAHLETKIEGNTQRLNDKIDANYASLNTKLDGYETKLNHKLDSIPQRLAEEFRAMRAEMSAQTAAIASAVTAAKQVPPQVLLVPAPAIDAPAPKQ
jgi:hypothetical protein